MTASILRSAAALGLVGCATAFAAPVMSQAELVGQARRLHQFEQAYVTDTGERIIVASIGDAMRVRYGRRPAWTLNHDGQGAYLSADGSVSLRFEFDGAGDPRRVQLTMPGR